MDDLRMRVLAALRRQEERVREVARGDSAPALRSRTLAFALRAMTDEASAFGIPEASGLAGRLPELLTRNERELGRPFWASFERWFSRCCDFLCMLLRGLRPAVTRGTLLEERGQLELGLEDRRAHGLAAVPGQTAPARRILFLDDSPTARAVVAASLAEHGYVVRVAANLREVAVQMLDFEPHLVISDVELDGFEGDELCRSLKQTLRKVVPIVLYSSLPDHELVARASAAGADACVAKYRGPLELVRCVDALLVPRAELG